MRSRSRKRRLGLRQDVERAEPRRVLALGEIEVRAKLAGDGELAVLERQLAGDEQLAVEMEKGHVVGDRRRDLGQGEVERLQPCFDLSCHVASIAFQRHV